MPLHYHFANPYPNAFCIERDALDVWAGVTGGVSASEIAVPLAASHLQGPDNYVNLDHLLPLGVQDGRTPSADDARFSMGNRSRRKIK